jgi:hypothetical protein
MYIFFLFWYVELVPKVYPHLSVTPCMDLFTANWERNAICYAVCRHVFELPLHYLNWKSDPRDLCSLERCLFISAPVTLLRLAIIPQRIMNLFRIWRVISAEITQSFNTRHKVLVEILYSAQHSDRLCFLFVHQTSGYRRNFLWVKAAGAWIWSFTCIHRRRVEYVEPETNDAVNTLTELMGQYLKILNLCHALNRQIYGRKNCFSLLASGLYGCFYVFLPYMFLLFPPNRIWYRCS